MDKNNPEELDEFLKRRDFIAGAVAFAEDDDDDGGWGGYESLMGVTGSAGNAEDDDDDNTDDKGDEMIVDKADVDVSSSLKYKRHVEKMAE